MHRFLKQSYLATCCHEDNMLGVIVQPKELCDEKHCPFNALRFNSRQIGEKPTYDLPTSEVGIPWTIGTKMATFDS